MYTKKRSGSISESSETSSTVAKENVLDNTCSNEPKKTHKSRRRVRSRRSNSNKQSAHAQVEVVKQLSEEEAANYIAMDCEMVGVGYKGRYSALARVTLIDWNGETVMDEFIQPPCVPITDYRTHVSGITAEQLSKEATLTFDECRTLVLLHLKDKILVGHALKNDLSVLDITHPWYDVRDTAKYEPFMKKRFDDNVMWPRKLSELAQEKLARKIQLGTHSPHEDALAALDLYKCVRNKFEKSMAYKHAKTLEIMQQQQQAQ
jgi:RNA exonuclease 4